MHRFDPVDSDPKNHGALTYAGFEILRADRTIERGRCWIIEQPWINIAPVENFLEIFAFDKVYDGGGVTSSFIKAIARNDDTAWTKRKCEAFFNDNTNFITSLGEAQKLIAKWLTSNVGAQPKKKTK